MTRDQYVEAVKASFVSIATKSAMSSLVASGFPAWALRIVEPLVSHIMKAISTKSEMLIFFQYIDWRVAGQKRDFEDAVALNIKAQASGNKEEIKRAEENLINAARNFIKLTN
jgi:hypothetical protein